MTQDELKKIVTRVAEEVKCESGMTAAQRGFKVEDLREQLGGLGDGDLSAWEISYKTSSVSIGAGPNIRDIAGSLAWEISYKTSSAALPRNKA
jgi:hypothetical protein